MKSNQCYRKWQHAGYENRQFYIKNIYIYLHIKLLSLSFFIEKYKKDVYSL